MALSESPSGEESSYWLSAYRDPVASLYTFTSCLGLADLQADGDHKLLVADLGTGSYDMKLKVFKGTSLHMESAIVDLPTGVCTFYMDENEPRVPAVAVASGPFIYIYKNLRPYFKFTVPPLPVNVKEKEAWDQYKEGIIDVTAMRETLDAIDVSGGNLSVRSLRFLQLDPEDFEAFANQYKHAPLKIQTVITCIGTMKKTHSEDQSVSCLVLGTEAAEIFVLDPQAFTILAKMSVPSVPVFLRISGLFEVEFRIIVSCRDGNIYTLRKGGKSPKSCIELTSQPVGLEKLEKSIAVGCMDRTLNCYTLKGKRLWSVTMPEDIMAMALMDHKAKGFRAVLVSLANGEVRLYKDRHLVNKFQEEDSVTAMKFGRFGREEGALILTTKSGGLVVRLLKRTAEFEAKEQAPGPPAAQSTKLDVPKKTKVAVDQIHREREHATAMHRAFQHDLYRLKLETARTYVKSVKTSLNPVSTSATEPLRLHAKVHGIGPLFKMTVEIQNTSSSKSMMKLLLVFKYDVNLYSFSRPIIKVPFLVPSLPYSFETLIHCYSDVGVADSVKVFVVREESSVPLISATISMPVSESVVVV
ncbi:Bardet-Biedl syndrome 1 protein homolog isoform X2 [Oscarella lobularis]|uniref:Bardet-Biedl syndrome 1 protein homolog isoform X2 n=1 Tax=Oscarella lobularis TaxID=121494 RepID=UPI0033134962